MIDNVILIYIYADINIDIVMDNIRLDMDNRNVVDMYISNT